MGNFITFDFDDDLSLDASDNIKIDDDDFSVEEEKPKRVANDFYATPQPVVDEFFDCFDAKTGYLTRMSRDGSLVLDPCAGGDEFNPMPYPAGLIKHDFKAENIITNDIRPESPAKYHHDFLTGKIPLRRKPDLIASNVPFLFAQDFVDKAFEVVADHGFIIFLLRLNFLASQARREWWTRTSYKPYGIFVQSSRPSFTDNGKTDGTDYAHFVWWKNPNIRTTLLEWV